MTGRDGRYTTYTLIHPTLSRFRPHPLLHFSPQCRNKSRQICLLLLEKG